MLTLEGVRRNLVGGVVDGCVEARAPEAAALLPAHVKGRAVARFVGDHFWRAGCEGGEGSCEEAMPRATHALRRLVCVRAHQGHPRLRCLRK